jgi:glycosyltransferase involved in cell wall biosynthesis
MHVLLLPSWYPTDRRDVSGSFFREQALALRKHGCKVGVIYPQLRSLRDWRSLLSGKRGIAFEDDEQVLTYRSHGTNWFGRMRPALRSLWIRHGLRLYSQYVRAHGAPDLIHVHSALQAGLVAREIQRLHQVPYVLTEHSSAFARNLMGRHELRLASAVAKAARARFAVSPTLCQLLTSALSGGNGDWTALPNVVNEAFATYPLSPSNHGDAFTFVNVGFLTGGKRQVNIILAFAAAFKDVTHVRLTIAGDGPEMPVLRGTAARLGLTDRIRFAGMLTRDEVVHCVAQSDAFVLSSQYETFGVALIEALALGKPVIATRCGGPESIVRDQDGFLVPVDDVARLAEAMVKLYKQRSLFDPLQIRQGCLDRFGEEAVARQLLSAYACVASPRCE